jgi:hypothetical protein
MERFEITYKNKKVKVEQRSLGADKLFIIMFTDRKPLAITPAHNNNSARFWTSIPEGRQKEAEEIGPLIEEYIKSTLN